MNLRSDHVGGGAFVGFGVLVLALSGDLPTGQLSMPGAGFLPKLIAALTIIFGLALFFRARESEPLSTLGWSDGKHAALVIAITAAATALYTSLGFITTMMLMMIGLLVIVERRNVLRAALYSVCTVMVTYAVFVLVLKAPLLTGPLGF
ncbi:MAG: tripartite tricarboxylate transporter TctB family protein [Hyphomicrobiales bacterium]